jgi:hypothetical protein
MTFYCFYSVCVYDNEWVSDNCTTPNEQFFYSNKCIFCQKQVIFPWVNDDVR